MTNQTTMETSNPAEQEVRDRLTRRPWPTTPIRSGAEVSFEFFPPSTPAGEANLVDCAQTLAAFGPSFMSVTYGAGGTTQDRTLQTIKQLASTEVAPIAGHLTCVGATRNTVDGVIDQYLSLGVRHIVALRGDPPEGHTDGTVEGGYRTAAELVAGIRQRADGHGFADEDFEISVGAYPEVHPRAASANADLDNLKAKFDGGATRAITQFFFDPDVFLRFLDRARSAGITAPIVPGIMPVNSYQGIKRFADRCGASIPAWLDDLFGGLDEAPEIRQLVAATVAAEQCRRLAEHGVRHFHFYTLNKPELSAATCRILGLAPTAARSSTNTTRTQVAS